MMHNNEWALKFVFWVVVVHILIPGVMVEIDQHAFSLGLIYGLIGNHI